MVLCSRCPFVQAPYDEAQLVQRAAGGDRAAAEELVRAHQGALFGFLLRMCGKRDIAEDICQEAFVRALTNLDRFDGRYRFSTWLFTIARRLLLNHLQKRKPVYDTEGVLGRVGTSGAPGEPAQKREQDDRVRSSLRAALMGLSAEQREVILLFHQLGWPIALIADHLGMPEGTVKSHLHRGREHLRQILEENQRHCKVVGEARA